ncbi:MAG: hypothetical protein AMXMBFR7_43590 [Planctomycetota bacterium]
MGMRQVQSQAVPPVPNDLNHDSRLLADAALWDGLDLVYAPLQSVRTARARGAEAEARSALVSHFRLKRTPKITKYRTDRHWTDWQGGPSLLQRANALVDFSVYEGHEEPICVGRDGRIDWKAANRLKHEIVRQGAMATLAEAWARTGKACYANALRAWMESHWQQQPFVLDPAFHREEFALFGGEAYPQLSSCYVLFQWADILDSKLMRSAGALPDDFWFEFIKRFWFLAYQFTRYLGASWRADNHHLMERGTACYFLGVGYPEFKRAKEMEQYARRIVRQHFDHNVLPDHTGSESCMAYQYRCLVRYAKADSVAQANRRSLLGRARERKLKDWLDSYGQLCAPDGRLPDTGDGGGPTLQFICEQSGALYGSASLKAIASALGCEGPVNPAFQAQWDRVVPRAPQPMSRFFPNIGHLVLRDGWRRDSHWLWLGAKNEGLFDIHTHWNTFDFTLCAFGRRIIGNPNSRTYGLPRGLARGYYYSMDAHNTLVIDNDTLKSHAALANSWGLQPTRITVAATCLRSGVGLDYATFRHDGYRPLLHRRDVFFVRGRYLIFSDCISMNFAGFNTVFATEGDIRPHHYRQRLHFETGVSAQKLAGVEGLDARGKDGCGALIVPEPFENLSIVEGPNQYLEDLNVERWRGYRMADITRQTIGACFFSTVYYPHDGRKVPTLRVTALTPRQTPFRNDRYHAILIDDGEFQDLWLLQRDLVHPLGVVIGRDGLHLQTDAAVLFLSMSKNKIVSTFRIGGASVRLNGQTIKVSNSKLTWHMRPAEGHTRKRRG